MFILSVAPSSDYSYVHIAIVTAMTVYKHLTVIAHPIASYYTDWVSIQ